MKRALCYSVVMRGLGIGLCAFLVMLGAVEGLWSGTVDGRPERLRIGFQVIPNTEAVVKGLGWLEAKLGVPIEWKQFESGRDVNTAIAAGGIDIGLVGSAPAAAGIAQGLPYEVIWIYDLIGDNEALVVRKGKGIKSAVDLVGRKIAVPFGSTTHYHLLRYLQLEGVEATRVVILDMQPPDMLAAWQRGDIDGGWVWHPTLGKMVAGGGEVIYSSRQMAERGVPTGDLGVVRREFGRRYPRMVAQYLAIQNEAVELYRKDPERAVRAVAKEFRLREDEARVMMRELIWLDGREQLSEKYLGRPGKPGKLAEVLKDTGDFLKAQRILKESPGIEVFRRAVNPGYLWDAMRTKGR